MKLPFLSLLALTAACHTVPADHSATASLVAPANFPPVADRDGAQHKVITANYSGCFAIISNTLQTGQSELTGPTGDAKSICTTVDDANVGTNPKGISLTWTYRDANDKVIGGTGGAVAVAQDCADCVTVYQAWLINAYKFRQERGRIVLEYYNVSTSDKSKITLARNVNLKKN